MKKSLTKNYIYNLIYQILILIVPFITIPYISRVLGAENIGIYSYTISISAYFILFGSLGIALYGQREIAFFQKDKKKYSVVFWEVLILRIITMMISLVLFYIFFVRGKQYQVYYRILIIEIIGNCVDTSWFFQGLEEFKKIVLRNTIIKIISVISIFVFVKTKDDLIIYFIIYVLSVLIGNISLWLYIPKYIKKVKFKEMKIFRHLKPTISLFIPQIAIQVYTLLDRTMVGAIIENKSEVGFYDQSQRIIKVILVIITSMGTVMMPRVANKFANGEKEKIQEYMKKSFNMVFFIAFPFIFGVLTVSKLFVPIFFGPGYDRVSELMCVISPILLLIGLSNVTGMQYLLPTKRQKEFTISVIGGAVINFSLNMLLIKRLGALGASIGTVIAETTVTGIQLYCVRKEFNIGRILALSKNYIVSGIIMYIICFVIQSRISNNLVSIITQVCIGGTVYFLCLIAFKDKFLFEIFQRIKSKLLKNKRA